MAGSTKFACQVKNPLASFLVHDEERIRDESVNAVRKIPCICCRPKAVVKIASRQSEKIPLDIGTTRNVRHHIQELARSGPRSLSKWCALSESAPNVDLDAVAARRGVLGAGDGRRARHRIHRLGHANPAITLQVYSHFFKHTEGSTADDMANVILNGNGRLRKLEKSGHSVGTQTDISVVRSAVSA